MFLFTELTFFVEGDISMHLAKREMSGTVGTCIESSRTLISFVHVPFLNNN